MADLSFSSIPLHNNSCVGVNLYILPELNKVITEAGLSVGDQIYRHFGPTTTSFPSHFGP